MSRSTLHALRDVFESHTLVPGHSLNLRPPPVGGWRSCVPPGACVLWWPWLCGCQAETSRAGQPPPLHGWQVRSRFPQARALPTALRGAGAHPSGQMHGARSPGPGAPWVVMRWGPGSERAAVLPLMSPVLGGWHHLPAAPTVPPAPPRRLCSQVSQDSGILVGFWWVKPCTLVWVWDPGAVWPGTPVLPAALRATDGGPLVKGALQRESGALGLISHLGVCLVAGELVWPSQWCRAVTTGQLWPHSTGLGTR